MRYTPPVGDAARVLRAYAEADEAKTITVPCRYCGAPCEMSESYVAALTAWNMANRGDPPICKGDVMVCEGCHPRWDTEVAGASRRQTQQVMAVCADIRRGSPCAVPEWMTAQPWASKQISEARAKRAAGDAVGDELT